MRVTCLTMAEDRFHFWKIFGESEKGVCLWFDRAQLEKDIKKDETLVAHDVQYPSNDELRSLQRHLIPFAKRAQYTDEREFRIIRTSTTSGASEEIFNFSSHSLQRIYLNPWLTSKDASKEKDRIRKILGDGLGHVKVLQNRSLLSRDWIISAKSALKASP